MFKMELHVHTKYASGCGKMDAESIVRSYLDAGYSGIMLTDHYNRFTLWYPKKLPLGNDLHGFLEGFNLVKEAGDRLGLKVYQGAEIRFDEAANDYLLFNYPDELLADPDGIFEMGLEKFSQLMHQTDAMLIQAHPCRSSSTPACHPVNSAFLDGVEVFNACIGNINNNQDALRYAEANPSLIRTQGSDCHRPEGVGLAGIGCDYLPCDEAELVKMLRCGEFSLLEHNETTI